VIGISKEIPLGDDALAAFEARLTPEGLFQSYCIGRSRHFWTRQLLIGCLFPVFYILVGPELSLIAAICVLAGESLDCGVLHHLAKHTGGPSLKARQWLTTATGSIQALSLSYVIWLALQSQPEAKMFATAICFAAILDAALLAGLHWRASVARCLLYVTLLLQTYITIWLQAPHYDVSLFLDTMAAGLLAYIIIVFVQHVQRAQRRRTSAQRAILEKGHEVAKANIMLQAAKQSSRQLAMVVEQASDSVIISDANGHIIWVNEAFTRTMGYTFYEVEGKPTSMLNSPLTDPKTVEQIVAARKRLEPIRVELVNIRKDGEQIWVQASLTPLLDDTGHLLNVVGVERDITEAKDREAGLAAARQQAEAAANAKNAFLATMSHEIRTPMNGVIATAELLTETQLDTEQSALVQTIASSGEALLTIINDILDFSKLDAGKLDLAKEPFSMEACLRDVVTLMSPVAKAKGLFINLTVEPIDDQKVLGDEGRMRQIMLNLIGNAIKFTHNGGVVAALTQKQQNGSCKIGLSVSDSGVGISNSRLNSIFDTFTQADASISHRFGGTGLGLTISQRLAKAMKGRIKVISHEGKGSCFTLDLIFDLDLTTTKPLPKTTTDTTAFQSEELRGLHVLVAEDNRTNRVLLEKLLKPFNLRMSFAEDGATAVAAFVAEKPQLILMDMSMPIMDGLEATRQIRELEARQGGPAIPIIALTANAYEADRKRCLDAGMNGYLTKPFRKMALLQEIAVWARPMRANESVLESDTV
jgi:PAS domain S-box-containing protein